MKTDFAKAIEAGEDVVGKEIVLISDGWFSMGKGTELVVTNKFHVARIFTTQNGEISYAFANDFEFKHVLDKQKEAEADKLLLEENKRLKEQLDGATEVNKQYEQQIQMLKDDLFNLQMENARLDLAAQRWQMFDCEANRNIADKLLKKLADEAVETR